jgi:hypothetical protein
MPRRRVRGWGGTAWWPPFLVIALFVVMATTSWIGRLETRQDAFAGCLRETRSTYVQAIAKHAESDEHYLGSTEPRISRALSVARARESEAEARAARDMLIRSADTDAKRSALCDQWYPRPKVIPGL